MTQPLTAPLPPAGSPPGPATRNRPGEVARVGRALLALTKPRIVELLLVATVPTMALAARGFPPVGLVVATVVGGTFAAGGANALNMVLDRDIDARMSRTSHRPLVTGSLSPAAATAFALALEVAAFALLWVAANLLAAGLAAGAAAFYVGVYTAWLKRTTSQNIVIGGAAGAVPVLVAWAAVTGGLSPTAWGLFALILLWTPPHFWALAVKFRDDYAGVDVPMLPAVAAIGAVADRIAVYTLVLVVASLAIAATGALGPIYVAVAAAAGVVFLVKAARFRSRPDPRSALALFHWSITYLTVLFAAVGLSVLIPW